ncbi:MAG TPA: cupin domain-containing protein [Woeseiaceae bacterium]
MTEQRRTSLISLVVTGLVALAVIALLAAPAKVHGDEGAFTRSADSTTIEWGPCPEFMPPGCALAVLQGNPAEPNADVFFKLRAGTTAPLHSHSSAERMVLVSGEMRVRYEGQAPVVLQAGTYAYGPANLPHDATCNSDEDCVLFIAFEGPVDAHPVRE